MNRNELETYIDETYSAEKDCPWIKYPDYLVFRHSNNHKWFALVMRIPKAKLGLPGSDHIDVVNLKCDAVMIGSLRMELGFFPAYHMNKDNWITVALNDSVPDNTIKMLLDLSFDATATKMRPKAQKQE